MDFSSIFPRGWHKRGYRGMDRDGRPHSIDLKADGTIEILRPPGLLGKLSEQVACDAVISVLNGTGGNWGPSKQAPEGRLEAGIDRFALAKTVANPASASREDRLNMQVTKVIADERICQAVSKTGSVTSTMDVAVSSMRYGIEKKSFKPRDDILLVLDAMEIRLADIDPVIRAFRHLHGEWARSLGFRAIWVAAPGNQSFPLI